MRALIRLIINLALLAGAAITGGWVTTTSAYAHASRDGRIAMLAGVAVLFFVVACVALNRIKAKKAGSSRPASPYAAPARRR